MTVPNHLGASPDLRALLAAKEIVIVCGSGGVGKTTTAAALGAAAARELGGRVLVLTVDPARRLASAMGLREIGQHEVQIDPALLRDDRSPRRRTTDRGGRPAPKGELWAAMLDTKASWDDLIRRHAPDEQVRDAVLANPLYHNITERFVNSHDYIAMERLHEIHTSGRYDLVIVDTAPSRNALDFFDAPGRMTEFFGSRLLRWLTVPYRSRLFTAASKPFYTVADRVLGSRFLQDIAEFFILFQTMERGFVQRAGEVERILTDRCTTYCLVTTLETAPLAEARFLIQELDRRSLQLGAVIANKVLPTSLRNPLAHDAAALMTDPIAMRSAAQVLGADEEVVLAVGREMAARFADLSLVAARQSELLSELATIAETIASVPLLDDDIHDIAGLLRLGGFLGLAP